MTYQHEPYDRTLLLNAVKNGGFYSFSLGTANIADLGITDPDDEAQVRDGGRFDLTPWRKWAAPKPTLLGKPTWGPMNILHDASLIAGHLYLQVELGANDGTGDISASYSAAPNTAIRTVVLI